MRLYLKFLHMHLKCQMQYKKSFFLIILSQFTNTFLNFLGLQFIFSNFYDFKGFKRSEVILCFAIVLFAFSISEFISKGFDIFPNTISNGEFDKILIRPRNTIFLVFASKLDFSKIGSIIQSIIILVYSIHQSEFIFYI